MYTKLNFEVSKIASKDESRPVLTGVLLKSDRTVATDGYKLAEVKNVSIDNVLQQAKVDNVVVSGKELEQVVAGVKNIGVLEPLLEAKLVDNKVKIGNENREINLDPIVGNYPNYEAIKPKSEPTVKIRLNIKYLKELLNLIEKANSDTTKLVDLELRGALEPVVLQSVDTTQEVNCLLMPVKPHD